MEEQFKSAKSWTVQEEVGESGTCHLQGCIEYKLQKDLTVMKKNFPRAHLEICRDWEASIEYCSKAESRKEGGAVWKSSTSYKDGLYDPLKDKVLFHWQLHLMHKMERYTPDMRSIYWYWEQEGNTGKSSFCKHIMIKGVLDACYVYGSTKDIAHVLAKRRELAKHPSEMPGIILFDCPRTGRINYHGLEMIKNGLFMSGKYDSSTVEMNPPFIVVLANFPPQPGELSLDRLKVYKINEAKEAHKDKDWAREDNYFNPPSKMKALLRRTDSSSARFTDS